jgi:two-component system nitrogen regulation response regulator NtrX
MALDILVVDDEPDIRELMAGVLGDEGYSVRTADTAERALEEVRSRTPRLVILDVWLQGSGMDGLSLLKYLKSIDPILPVIVISGHGNIETAIAAIRRGDGGIGLDVGLHAIELLRRQNHEEVSRRIRHGKKFLAVLGAPT